MLRCLTLIALILVLGTAAAEAKGGPKAKEVQAAVARGADWLRKTHGKEDFETERKHSVPELVVLTLHHARVSRKDPVFKKGLETILMGVEARYFAD